MNAKLFVTHALCVSLSFAHFGVLIPSSNIVEDENQSKLNLTYKFTHPFEQILMNMQTPEEVAVVMDGKKTNLSSLLKNKKEGKNSFFTAEYKIKDPGLYTFFTIPSPYFEPNEEKFIKHITKSYVNAYGEGGQWNKPVGLKAEIVPLTRPYGLYKGNLFSAKVLYKGKPAKNVPVEVEYYNQSGLKAPSDDHIAQVVMTNEQGEFSFVMPLTGWWGFAALIDDDETIAKDGKKYPIELGAVLWVKTDEYKK